MQSPHLMDDGSSAIALVPLFLIVVLLVIILCTQPQATFLCTDNTTSRRHEPELEVTEEEPLLSLDDTSPRDDRQVQSMGETFPPSRLTAEIDRWKDANSRKAQDIAKLRRDLSASISQNAELQKQYATLCRDLEGARLFLNTADTFADSEVIQILQKLNTELQHTSTFIADHAISVFKIDAVTSDLEQQTMVDRASEIIGSTFVQFLRTARRDDPEIPMYLQIALQAYLTHRLCWIASSWTIDERCSKFINGVYQRLRETEKQMVSGRWRSLARLHAHPTCVEEPSSLVAPIIAGISHLLLAVGCAATQSDIVLELSSMFEEKLLAAITLAGRLNQMISGVVSGDFEVFVARPGDMFHRGTMEEDMDGDGDVSQKPLGGMEKIQTVLCATELGLTKQSQLEMGERETTTVIKAKVILESFLDTEH